ncbi:hypothetical protein PJJ30_29450, partial [Mycobacterium kansasii]
MEQISGLFGSVFSVAFSPDGRRIVSGSDEKIGRASGSERVIVLVEREGGDGGWVEGVGGG